MTYRDTVPVPIYHHDAEEHAKREEEQAVDVVLDGVANRHREGEEDDLRNREEGGSEYNVADRPAVLECTEDKYELRDDIDDSADQGPEDVYDPQSDRLRVVETSDPLEGSNRDEERHTKGYEHGYPKQLKEG